MKKAIKIIVSVPAVLAAGFALYESYTLHHKKASANNIIDHDKQGALK